MTGQMLRYRAAAFWVKVYYPEISLGLMTQEEVADVQVVAVAAVEPSAAQSALPVHAIPVPLSQPEADGSGESVEVLETDRDGAIQNSTTAEVQASTAVELQDAPAPRRSTRRSAAAQRRSEGPAVTARDESSAEQVATERTASPQPTDALAPAAHAKPAASVEAAGVIEQSELATHPAPGPGPAAAAQPSAAELLTTALQEIPKLATPAAPRPSRSR